MRPLDRAKDIRKTVEHNLGGKFSQADGEVVEEVLADIIREASWAREISEDNNELIERVAEALMCRYSDKDYGVMGRPADQFAEGPVISNPATAQTAARRAIREIRAYLLPTQSGGE